jgi:HAD superfamily hydrolase (TIGR01509 family)
MDGVLIDSQPLHFKIDLEVLRISGATLTQADVERFAGAANRERWLELKRIYNIKTSIDDLIKRHVETVMKLFRESDIQPTVGIIKLLELLKSNNIKTAVASSSSQDLIDLVISKLKIASFFDELITGEDAPMGKPAPDVFLMSAKKLRAEPSDCVVIEDSANGVLAAKRAGMYCVGYKNPTSGNQDISLADMVIDSFNEINIDIHWL